MGRWRRAAGLAALLLAGCSSTGAEPATQATPRTSPPTVTSDVMDTTAASEPMVDQPPPTSVDLPAGEDDNTGEVADDPVPRAAQASVVRPGSSMATPRESTAADRIDIPKIGLSHRTFEGIDLATINKGPSHWPGTALPGQRGNTVFPGHRTTYSRPFWDIDKLTRGDEVIFTSAAGRFVYRVTDTFVVRSNETWIVDATDEATFTIFACHPKGSAKQRYVVKGRLTTPPTEPPSAETSTAPPPPSSPPSSTTTTAPSPAEEPPLIPKLPE